MFQRIIPLLLSLSLAGLVQADTLKLRDDAPARYVVKRGDTLWDISGRYLSSPWKWPQLWQMNRSEIRNPHWIYPGDVLVLDRATGKLRLEKGSRVVKLSPHIRIEDSDAISSIPASRIAALLKRPLVIEQSGFAAAPRIIAGADERVVLAQGNTAYSQPLDSAGVWQAFRAGKELTDPDSKENLGFEVIYGGDLAVTDLGTTVSTLQVKSSVEEIAIGDRLVKYQTVPVLNYQPRPAPSGMGGKVISIYGGVADAAQYSSVVINRGAREGAELGYVFGVYKQPRTVKVDGKDVTLPSPEVSRLFVYRVFDKVSYGLLLDSRQPVNVGDTLGQPE
ncbi:LysM peptidoglycan-binding domain-containing protein [Craterilacuibacter sp.]|uniref:LysM peptidoglycan-binding domain-containing protein n=1 Tax=Craterilacuibacter sp. TaxID=2870909 RepID=UPI003F37B0A6